MTENLETRSLLDDLRNFDKGGGFLDLGHPLLNRITHSFVKAAGIGAVQAVARDAYFTVSHGAGFNLSGTTTTDITGTKRQPFHELRGENGMKSLEAMVKNTSKESFQWGLAAGMYSGLTYGLTEARGSHDWKNSAIAGAITGAALALTADSHSHEQIVNCAITGAAVSTAANLLTGIF
ncbi:hypothetical protein QJS10_CPA16g01642 [Acorus calamus]|uniref:Outer envelope pore protein 16-2, chloroplastic n=1 Tax=Acorus calamus TaxID=4465 RepID=A0AAV9CZ19_ACOCL|nr:hypothetical protein QJS10_CPA16g01642 [Acorus calamus]